MATVRFDPFHEFASLQNRVDRFFGGVPLGDEGVSARGSWVPLVDIYETDSHDLVITADLPDVTREEIEVTADLSSASQAGSGSGAGDRPNSTSVG